MSRYSFRTFRGVHMVGIILAGAVFTPSLRAAGDASTVKPNILFAIADDWGWPHAGAYGDPVVKTPTFDRLAREGILFRNAFIASPSCTPSRGSILTGEWPWELGSGCNLHGDFPDGIPTYMEILGGSGYVTGFCSKGWGPGKPETPGRELTGRRYRDFEDFLSHRETGKPFCFWLGSQDPHRPYEQGSGRSSGMDLNRIRLFKCFPDVVEVRSDVADYYWEVQRFDTVVGKAIDLLEKNGELDNTVVFMTGDHGMPFPRCKGNLYDSGTHVPLAARWTKGIHPGRVVDDFISLTDLAPTLLQLAGVEPREEMSGKSFSDILTSEVSGQVDPTRDSVLFGRERHTVAQESPDRGGYPSRGIRTSGYLYIRNFRPDRWPAGTPNYRKATIPGAWYSDCDNGPTKIYMIENRSRDEIHRKLYRLAFAKRPAEELYDLSKDPDQLVNVAEDTNYAEVKRRLSEHLINALRETHDPRILGGGDEFDRYPYTGGAPKHPSWRKKQQ